MARSGSRLSRTHGKLWYDVAAYRWAWLVLPQAVALTLMGLLVMDGGFSTLFNRRGAPVEHATTQWGKPVNDGYAALVPLRDKAGKEGNAEALAALEKMAASGDVNASFYLGTIYDPRFGDLPHPKVKDVNRALFLYGPGVKSKNLDALYNTMANYASDKSKVHDPAAACILAHDIVKHPDFAKEASRSEDEWLKITVADCLAGFFRPKNSVFVEVNKADAEAAIALYQEPRLVTYLDAKRSIANIYLRHTSPVFDIGRGCNAARTWVDQVIGSNYTFSEHDRWILPTAAGCILNIFRSAGVQYTVPAIADQNKAVTLLDQPVIKDDAFAQRVSSLAHVNAALAIKDVAKAQDKARAWARNPAPESDVPVDSIFFIFVADSLMGVGGGKPYEPDQTDIALARNLYTRVAGAGDTTGWHRIGFIYERGIGSWAKDLNKARQAYEKCKNELVECKERLGVFQEFGNGGFDKNPGEALRLYRECSSTGSAFCDTRLAIFHSEGMGGLPRNPVMATRYARKAAEGGNRNAAELYAIFLYNGTGLAKPDFEASARWMVTAIEQSGQTTLQMLRDVYVKEMKNPAFWTSFHNELRARAVYYGPISGTPTAATFEAAAKLWPR